MVIRVTIETKYAAPLSQLHNLLHVLHSPNLSSFRAFPSPPSVLPSSIILVIIICYLRIITMKKLMNLDRLTCCCRRACFVSIDKKSAQAGPTFNSICTVCKSSARIS